VCAVPLLGFYPGLFIAIVVCVVNRVIW